MPSGFRGDVATTCPTRTFTTGCQREGIVLAAAGIGTGLVLAAWVGHALRQQLYGVDRLDTFSLGFASIVLAAVALVASWLPARRAARVDPVIALRES